MPVKVKICGITNLSDALMAVDAGADALGFMFCETSPRCISFESSARIIRELPPFIVKVGVFVNAKSDFVAQGIQDCGLNLLQFHGDETPEYCLQFGLMSMKAFRVFNADTLASMPAYNTDAWLLDAFAPGKRGGTGERFDWELAVQARKMGRPLFLAGGLTPENVGEAVQKVRPYGVDVSSGVEEAAGKKSHQKLKAFIQAVKNAG